MMQIGPSGDSERRTRSLRTPGVNLLGTLGIRKKLIVLHTLFSLVLGVVIIVTLRPGASAVVERAETSQAKAALDVILAADFGLAPGEGSLALPEIEGVTYKVGSAGELGLDPSMTELLGADPNGPVATQPGGAAMMLAPPGAGEEAVYVLAQAEIPRAREAVIELYAFIIVAILAVYGLIAAFLELFVLPQNVYAPIARLLEADDAVQEGDEAREIIDEAFIPADEMGSIMRSRNETVRSLRQHEQDLADALGRFEIVAADLKRKNHLLESAKRNLADADRLASLGMLSAGIAHELNTPLTVVKGLAEKLERTNGKGLTPTEAQLMVRVVGRLEKLGESLLDFARVRPAQTKPEPLRELVEEAVTLVRLDRGAKSIELTNEVPHEQRVACDADRIVQVLVNLIRNAVDAVSENEVRGQIRIISEPAERDGGAWVSLKIIDNGPGIEPALIERLFDPFVSSRLDAKGTGLGLAVAQGIAQEHGGVIVAHNRSDGSGAVFEVVLPVDPPEPDAEPASDTLGTGEDDVSGREPAGDE